MGDRMTTVAGALAALLIFAVLFYQPSRQPEVSRPVSSDQGNAGYSALHRWLELSAVRAISLRKRYNDLFSLEDLPVHGNVLVTTTPYVKPLRSDEKRALDDWVSGGNTLLVLAALNDSPRWMLNTGTGDFLEQLEDLTGLRFVRSADEEGTAILVGNVFEETELVMTPVPSHPLMAQVRELLGVTDSTTMIWEPEPSLHEAPFAAQLAFEGELGRPSMWQIPRGNGQVIVSSLSSLLSNRMLGEADNARFLANLLAYHLQPEAAVVFDDHHQGISELYDPEAFFSDARLYASLCFLLAFWLLYLVGGAGRLVPVKVTSEVPRQSDLVDAIGGFMSRKLAHAECGRVMVDGWLRDLELRGQVDLRAGNPWQQLRRLPMLAPDLLHAIEDAYTRLGRGEKVDLRKLHNNLQMVKRTLA